MNTISILSLAIIVFFSSCSHFPSSQQDRRESVFPGHTIFPNQQNIPRRIIDDLPRRIAALPEGRPLSINRLVERLGLSAYRSNVSANLRWNTFFMYLDSDHILYFLMDLDTLPDQLVLQTPWSAKVIECSMRRNPDVIVVSKQLARQ